jgi:hypothetical protein
VSAADQQPWGAADSRRVSSSYRDCHEQ